MLAILIEFKCILGKLEFIGEIIGIGSFQTDSSTISLLWGWLKYIFINGTYYRARTLSKNKDLKAKIEIIAWIRSVQNIWINCIWSVVHAESRSNAPRSEAWEYFNNRVRKLSENNRFRFGCQVGSRGKRRTKNIVRYTKLYFSWSVK